MSEPKRGCWALDAFSDLRADRLFKNSEWVEEYFEVKVQLEDPAELKVAKANLTGLIDGWLFSASKPAAKPAAPLPQEPAKKKINRMNSHEPETR